MQGIKGFLHSGQYAQIRPKAAMSLVPHGSPVIEGLRRFTAVFIRGLRPDPKGKDIVHFDGRIPGFGVRVKPSGVRDPISSVPAQNGRTQRKVRVHYAVQTP